MYKILLLKSIMILLIIFSPVVTALAESGVIKGHVTDAQTGNDLPGANIILKGTNMGAAADLNGDYIVRNVPEGTYTVRASYVGYVSEEVIIDVKGGMTLTLDFQLQSVSIEEADVVVTAQASGQNSAINQQLASDKIVNVVSSARIQELPDVNAAESVGRLPGVYMLRSGGEGYAVAIRGLRPQYNEVTINGVPMPPTDAGNRTVNMSMISSNMLSGIEVFKTVTPDMDASVLGGVVNFQIREARPTSSALPEIQLSAQGGYNDLQNDYGIYKFTGAVGDRFFNDRLGIFVQGIVEKVNRTSAELNASYDLLSFNYSEKNPLELTNLTPSYHPRKRQRYDATLTIDYKLNEGKISLMNFFSSGETNTENRSQSYIFNNNDIFYGAGYSPSTLNVLTNLLDFKYDIFSFDMNLKLSHSYTENINKSSWSVNFRQASNLSGIDVRQRPEVIAQSAMEKTNFGEMYFDRLSTSDSFKKQKDLRASLDFERVFNLSNLITAKLKFGGAYKSSSLAYNYDDGFGSLYYATARNVLKAILENFPWMTKPPYNMNPNNPGPLPITLFADQGFNYGNFLNGAYKMNMPTNLDLIKQVLDFVVDYTRGRPVIGGSTNPYSPDPYGSGVQDYSGNEYENAAYIMTTLKIGPQITIIPGVRYQGIKTSYKASWYFNAGAPNPYPRPLAHTDTTINQYNGYWLPDVSLIYAPLPWMSLRAAYTNTLSYPSPNQITPVIAVNEANKSVIWHNYKLKPARSQNYDVAVSVFNNSIGLFTAGGFLKRIDKMIFGSGIVYITDPADYPGLPPFTKGYILNTSINNPFRVNVLGMELDWQTHFWYLPDILSGLVFSINYTHIFSEAKYPYTVTYPGKYPDFKITYVDTFYTDRLIYQPKDVINLSVGFDYKDFSVVASMIYQSNVFNSANFWPELRSDKGKYLRWDLVLKQKLPWFGLEAYLNLNNINSESDLFLNNGNGFPQNEQAYGLTVDLGLRWMLE